MSDSSSEWYARLGLGIELGPMPREELDELAATGQLLTADSVREGTDGDWQPASEVPGLFPDTKPAETEPQPATSGDDGAQQAADETTVPAPAESPPESVREPEAPSDGWTTMADIAGGASVPARPSTRQSESLVAHDDAIPIAQSLDEFEVAESANGDTAEPSPAPVAEPSPLTAAATRDDPLAPRETLFEPPGHQPDAAPTNPPAQEVDHALPVITTPPALDASPASSPAHGTDIPPESAAFGGADAQRAADNRNQPDPEVPDIPAPAGPVPEAPAPTLVADALDARKSSWARSPTRWFVRLVLLTGGVALMFLLGRLLLPEPEQDIYAEYSAIYARIQERRSGLGRGSGWVEFAAESRATLDETNAWLESSAAPGDRGRNLLLYIGRDMRELLDIDPESESEHQDRLAGFFKQLAELYGAPAEQN